MALAPGAGRDWGYKVTVGVKKKRNLDTKAYHLQNNQEIARGFCTCKFWGGKGGSVCLQKSVPVERIFEGRT